MRTGKICVKHISLVVWTTANHHVVAHRTKRLDRNLKVSLISFIDVTFSFRPKVLRNVALGLFAVPKHGFCIRTC